MSREIGKLRRKAQRGTARPIRAILFLRESNPSRLDLIVWYMDCKFMYAQPRFYSSIGFCILNATVVEMCKNHLYLWGTATLTNCRGRTMPFDSDAERAIWRHNLDVSMKEWARADFWREPIPSEAIRMREESSISHRDQTEDDLLLNGWKKVVYR